MTVIPPEAIIAADDACLALMETGATAAALVRTAITAALPHIDAAAEKRERERIAGWLAEVASAYRDVEADATAVALDKCAVDLEADR